MNLFVAFLISPSAGNAGHGGGHGGGASDVPKAYTIGQNQCDNNSHSPDTHLLEKGGNNFAINGVTYWANMGRTSMETPGMNCQLHRSNKWAQVTVYIFRMFWTWIEIIGQLGFSTTNLETSYYVYKTEVFSNLGLDENDDLPKDYIEAMLEKPSTRFYVLMQRFGVIKGGEKFINSILQTTRRITMTLNIHGDGAGWIKNFYAFTEKAVMPFIKFTDTIFQIGFGITPVPEGKWSSLYYLHLSGYSQSWSHLVDSVAAWVNLAVKIESPLAGVTLGWIQLLGLTIDHGVRLRLTKSRQGRDDDVWTQLLNHTDQELLYHVSNLISTLMQKYPIILQSFGINGSKDSIIAIFLAVTARFLKVLFILVNCIMFTINGKRSIHPELDKLLSGH